MLLFNHKEVQELIFVAIVCGLALLRHTFLSQSLLFSKYIHNKSLIFMLTVSAFKCRLCIYYRQVQTYTLYLNCTIKRWKCISFLALMHCVNVNYNMLFLVWCVTGNQALSVELNRWKGKPSGSIACMRKQQLRFYWSCSSVEMNDFTPLTHHSAWAELKFQM